MKLHFFKYHGAGNDFVMIDSRKLNENDFTTNIVNWLCNRNFGIGGDGLILLLNNKDFDFRMKYFNSDGKEGSMCGNGGRCIVAFAKRLGIIENETLFIGIDGKHNAMVNEDRTISIRMNDVKGIEKLEDGWFLDTGSPHFVKVMDDIDKLDVYRIGKEIRNQQRFGPGGTNVNFVKLSKKEIKIRTFERGVENETLACGTGNVAGAIIAHLEQNTDKTSFNLTALGGKLQVKFTPEKMGSFTNIWLTGPAEFVFEGDIEI